VDRATKEAVAAACPCHDLPYCAEMHTVGLYDLSDEHDAEAIAGDRAAEVGDPRLRAAALWARHAHEAGPPSRRRPGCPRPPGRADRRRGVHALPDRMVNVFLANFLLPPGIGPRARRRFQARPA